MNNRNPRTPPAWHRIADEREPPMGHDDPPEPEPGEDWGAVCLALGITALAIAAILAAKWSLGW